MRYDVAVIGAGPAGATTALLLARAGASVCVVERSQFPRTKACGEYLNAGAVRLLRELGVAGSLAAHAVPLRGVRLSGKGARAELRFAAAGWSLPRATLDSALLDAALDAGATCKAGRAERFASGDDGVRIDVRTPGGELEQVQSSVLIGADGAHSLVAREFGLSEPVKENRRFALGGHYCGLSGLDDYLEMFVDGRSYFAINPFSASRANVMLIVDESELHRRRDDVDAFVHERARVLSGGRIQFDGARLEDKRIAIGPLAYRARRYSVPRVLLVGDSAHFLDPFTGQGVHFALRGAQLAGQAVKQMLWNSSAQLDAWQHYERSLRQEVRRRKRLSSIVGALVRVPFIASPAAAIATRNPLVFRGLLDAVTGAT